MAIALGGIQKHKYKCQNLDHCIFISRVIALEHRILTTTMHQSSPSSMTKSKSAKKAKEALLHANIDYLSNMGFKYTHTQIVLLEKCFMLYC